jgi:hypothetical protein
MSDAQTKTYQLIIRQRPVANPDLEALLQTLQADYGLDVYTARQRLVGPGLAMFGKGGLEKTGKIAALLQEHGLACWQIEPRKPTFAPDLLRSLEIRNEKVQLTCQKGTVILERGATVVGVLADLSGSLSDKHVKRLLAQNTYRGSDALEVISRDEQIKAILQGQPVFDFYLLDAEGQIQQAVQVMPGRFNVDGLGGRATLSTTQNLQAMVTLVEEYAKDFQLHCDFGLSQLPNCIVQRVSENPSAAVENLASLTRYGWLVSQLQGDGRPADTAPVNGVGLAAGVAAATVIGQPALGAIAGDGPGATAIPGLGEVAREIQDAIDDTEAPQAAEASEEKAPRRRDLPPPPDRPPTSLGWKKPLTMIGVVAAGITITVGSNGGGAFRWITKYGMAAGVVPAIAAVVLFWSGFHFIRLKRRIENTPTSKVRSIAMGMVEIHGRARRVYALVAPMTQSACAWYRLRKYRKDSKNNWKLVKQVNSNHVPFQIDDGTGRVVVDPMGASVKAKVQQTGYPGQSPLTFTAFGSSNDEDEKWIEDIIYEGTSLYVLGFARPLREQRRSLRDRTMARLRQLKLDPQAMRRYDTDGDGRIDESEWQAACADAEQEAMREHLAEGQGRKRQEEHVIIGKAQQRSLPFIVAEALSEAHLSRKYGWFSLPLLLGGVAATVLAIYKFLQYIRL